MKTIPKTATAALLLMCLTGGAQVSTEEKESQELLAKRKVKTATTYQADYGLVRGERKLGAQRKISKTSYDRRGEVTEEVTYGPRGTVESWIAYKQGKDGSTEYVNYNADGSVHHTSRGVVRRDSLGRDELTLIYASGGDLTHKMKNWYDGAGNLEQVDTYVITDDKAYLDSYVKHYYDIKGRTVKSEHFDHAGNYRGRVEFRYDASGRMSEKLEEYAYTFKYGANGLQTECASFGGARGDQPVSVYKTVYEYYQ